MAAQQTFQAEYTQGSIVEKMLKTALAMLASTLAMSAYNIADTFFVGRLGGEAPLAAMGFSFPIVMLVGCIFGGSTGGCMTTMAQAIGAGDAKRVCRIVASGLLLLTIISLVIAVVGIFGAEQIYGMLGAKGETLSQLKGYMNIWFFGCCTASISMMSNHLMIAAGKPRISSMMTILGMFINVVFDPVFIFGSDACSSLCYEYFPRWLAWMVSRSIEMLPAIPAMGIQGAAQATILSQCVAALAGLFLLWRAGLLVFQRIAVRKLLETWRLITSYAIPNVLGMILIPLTNYVVTWVTASFGDTVVAGVAAAGKLEMVAFVLPMAFGIPLMSIVAQNFGAGLYSRVRFAYRFASIMALVFLTSMAVLLFFFSPKIVTMFTPEAPIQNVMVTFMKIVPWGFPLLEITRFCGFALTGCGHPRQDAILKAVRMLVILVPLSLLTRHFHWLPGVYYSRLGTDVLGGLICIFFTVRMLRKLPKEDAI